MATYANKTCSKCGIRKPANEMCRVTQVVKTTSKSGVGKREVVGALLGNEKSQKKIQRVISSSNKRTHSRTKEV